MALEMKSNKRNFVITVLLFLVFVVYTTLVMTVDLGTGLEGTPLGFSTFNKRAAEVFPYNELWYGLTEYLGYVAIGVCFGFALLGLYQLIKGKGIKAVDKKLFALAGFYVVVVGFYAAFEAFTINFRPVMLEEGLEASYPSSHTVLGACVFLSAVLMLEDMLDNKSLLKAILQALFIVLALFTIIGRMLSGVHWITDIFGGVILSAALLMGFYTAKEKVR